MILRVLQAGSLHILFEATIERIYEVTISMLDFTAKDIRTEAAM
jgi:hypothetical protein